MDYFVVFAQILTYQDHIIIFDVLDHILGGDKVCFCDQFCKQWDRVDGATIAMSGDTVQGRLRGLEQYILSMNVTGIVLNADVGKAQACLSLSKWETYSSYPYADATQ